MKRVGGGQISRVYRSYLGGSRTTLEVSLHTGLPLKHCSAYTRALIGLGRLRCAGFAPDQEHRVGRKALWYEPVSAAHGAPLATSDKSRHTEGSIL